MNKTEIKPGRWRGTWAQWCARPVTPRGTIDANASRALTEMFMERPWRCTKTNDEGRRCVRRVDHPILDDAGCLFYFHSMR